MIPVEDALAIVLESSQPLASEEVALADALDRFLAEPVIAGDTIPGGPTSAMDGFAVRSADAGEGPFSLELVGEVPAGKLAPRSLGAGETMKIFTGSILPEGADAVIMVEKSRVEGSTVHLEGPAPTGQHVRPAGEVVCEGDRVLPAGIRIGPGHLSVLATLGYARPVCAKRPRVAILPTGSELVAVDAPLGLGQVRDSNSVALEAQIRRAGGDPFHLGVAVDEKEALKALVARGLEEADVLVTSGGVSMGDYDFVGEILDALGCTTHFTRVRTKPGKPVTYATKGDKQVFGLPGNPVSSMVSFELFCRPSLRKRMGALDLHRPTIEVALERAVKKAPGRRDYQRAKVEPEGDRFRARLTGPQGSGIMLSMAEAQALLVLDDARTEFAEGERVPAILLDEALEARTS